MSECQSLLSLCLVKVAGFLSLLNEFLLFCASEDSPMFANNGFCRDSSDNFGLVAKRGREPGLMLVRQNLPVSLHDWGQELVERIAPYAELLDSAYGTDQHTRALAVQQAKVNDTGLTPSAQLLGQLRETGQSFHAFTLQQSQAHHQALLAQPLPAETLAGFQHMAAVSLADQVEIENSDTESFDDYVSRYHQALTEPVVAWSNAR